MKESTYQAVKLTVWSFILFGLILLLGGFKLIKLELMFLQGLYTEHKMLSYIGITQAERMPADLIDATLAEKSELRLTFSADGTPIWEASPATENTERLKQFILNLLPEPPTAKANALGTRIFLVTEEYESFGHINKNINLRIINSYWMNSQKNWKFLYQYTPSQVNFKIIARETDLLSLHSMSNREDSIKVGYNSIYNMPEQVIPIKDYEAYMQARAAGKVFFLDPITAVNILEFAGKTPNTEMYLYPTPMPVRYQTADPAPTATP